MERSQPSQGNLMALTFEPPDTHERLVADILTRYRTILMLATIQAEGDKANTKPQAIAVAGISLRMEFDGLYSSVKELLSLSRKMKELWVFGPLGGDDADARARREERIETNVGRVADMLGRLQDDKMRSLAEEWGGSWAPLKTDGGENQNQNQTQLAATVSTADGTGAA
ncbi:Surfeit locus protein 5 subunit 22 of Mediator complex [Geosmithia morbida]|uniref:Surfeit locus protein 5 subunit 22 of Mediator complex n=1 Tax=Geosmithia morbida TaxID=1094350 RepID=A0A9P5CYF2_9HYPO|nr:Surfeit locus protein 5 subunit 22 of Mediator complex [Geosmithia morbida]KAF4119327.1 Surfeit locus protein 5 subunit 22 of Mediator complex [Geosmithia morbida]